MKLYILIISLVLILLISASEGRRGGRGGGGRGGRGNGQRNRGRGGGRNRGSMKCKWNKASPVVTSCADINSTFNVTFPVKAGSPTHCQPKTVSRRCDKKCKYTKPRDRRKPECVNGQKSIILNLVPYGNETSHCPTTKTKTKSCKVKPSPGCIYRGKRFGKCNQVTGKRNMTKTLQPNSSQSCPPHFNTTVPCSRNHQSGCKYRQTDWPDCNQPAEMVQRTLSLEEGKSGEDCDPTWTQEIKCKKLMRKKNKKNKKKKNNKKGRRKNGRRTRAGIIDENA